MEKSYRLYPGLTTPISSLVAQLPSIFQTVSNLLHCHKVYVGSPNLRSLEILPPCCQPSDDANQRNDSDRSTRVIHIFSTYGTRGRERESNAAKSEENETDGVKRDAVGAEGVGTRDFFDARGEVGKEAGEKRHCI